MREKRKDRRYKRNNRRGKRQEKDRRKINDTRKIKRKGSKRKKRGGVKREDKKIGKRRNWGGGGGIGQATFRLETHHLTIPQHFYGFFCMEIILPLLREKK